MRLKRRLGPVRTSRRVAVRTAQICVATKRLCMHEDVYDGLRDRLVAIAKAVRVGDGAEQGTVRGPIQNKRRYDRVMALIDDAQANNLTLIQGSDNPETGGPGVATLPAHTRGGRVTALTFRRSKTIGVSWICP